MVRFSHVLSAVDAHAGGEPARIVLSGLPPIPGATMADKKRHMRDHLDHFRTLLVREPRGHRDMFGVILTPPADPRAQYGLLFADNGGYLDMCGHGVMSATAALVEMGMLPPAEPETAVTFDTPAGLVECRARVAGGEVTEVSVANVPSFLYARDVRLTVPGVGRVAADVAFGGNFFALVRAADLGVRIGPDSRSELVRLGMAVKRAVNEAVRVRHPIARLIASVELTEIYQDLDAEGRLARNTVVFGDGQLDRCPCGTGTSAAMAARYARGLLPLGEGFTSEGILGTRFRGRLLREVRVGEFTAVEPVVTGSAYITGIQEFVTDPADPFRYGFTLTPDGGPGAPTP